MALGPTHVVVSIPANSGVSRDTIQMHFDFANPTALVENNINRFFNIVVSPNTDTLAGHLSPWLSRAANAMEIAQYHITATTGSHAPMGPPFATNFTTLQPTLGGPLPQEIQCAISYHALNDTIPEHAPGARPKSRYRGRVYFGPLITSDMDSDLTTHRCRVKSTLTTSLKVACADLLTLEPTWGVWSKVDGVVRPIVAGWIDDDFDVQRRRGTEAGGRLAWP